MSKNGIKIFQTAIKQRLEQLRSSPAYDARQAISLNVRYAQVNVISNDATCRAAKLSAFDAFRARIPSAHAPRLSDRALSGPFDNLSAHFTFPFLRSFQHEGLR